MPKMTRRSTLGALLATVPVMSCATTSASNGPTPSIEAVPGAPTIMLGMYDLATIGYRTEEFFISGEATSYARNAAGAVEPAATSPYATRVVVTRPIDNARFNGAVFVEWMNVTGGLDISADWLLAHRELARSGFVHVGVSAQRVGVEGGNALMGGGASMALKQANPARYGSLNHPGDAFSFDIFSQAGRALRNNTSTVLNGLTPHHFIAGGESQSAMFLSRYVNDIDPLARVYDGFLVHSRFGSAAALDGAPTRGPGSPPQEAVPFRADLRVPVLAVVTETDVIDGNLLGYARARTPDHAHLRVWEIAAAAHADNYLFGIGMRDNGTLTAAQLAQGFAPSRNSAGGVLERNANTGQPHHYVVQAAIAQLERWVRTGAPAPQAQPLASLEPPTNFTRDDNTIARGGVRTPWADVPTAHMSGVGNTGGLVGFLAGVTEPFDAAKLAQLYPGGRADYLRRFETSLDASIAAGFILQADRQEILDIAAAGWTGA